MIEIDGSFRAKRRAHGANPAARRGRKAGRAWALGLLLAALALLSACGYLPVEEAPIRVGDAIAAPAQTLGR